MRRIFVTTLFLAAVACGGEEETPLCDELGELCHDVGEAGDADAEACHELGHAGDEDACEVEYDACVEICSAAAGDTDTDA